MITRTTCRVCDGPLEDVFSLGEQYVSNFIDPSEPDGVKAPLDLVLCKQCTLLQLRHTVPPNAMYANYWYRSGTNKTMRDALADIVQGAEQLVDLETDNRNGTEDVVLDIGCNDGTLLGFYNEGLYKIGFDPAKNLVSLSRKIANDVITDFFTAEEFYRHFTEEFRPKVITSIAMFYDLEDPNAFVADIKQVMHPNGIWILQMSYLPTMLKQHDFGNICHEHLEYYSLKSLEHLLNKHDMVVCDVETNNVNGGSFRVYIQHREHFLKYYHSTNRVEEMRAQESKMNLGEVSAYSEFIARIERIKTDIHNFIDGIKFGKKVGVYGASTKGNVMLQYLDLDYPAIAFASERNPDKWGKVTVGTRIPIISEEEARKRKPDYFLVLPWHFIDEFVSREKEYLDEGGRFIVPLPHFTLI